MKARRRPVSASNVYLTSATAGLVIAVMLWLTSWPADPMIVMIACLLAIALPIGLVDILWNKVHRRQSAGLDGNGAAPPLAMRLPRVAIKLLGLWLTLAAIAG